MIFFFISYLFSAVYFSVILYRRFIQDSSRVSPASVVDSSQMNLRSGRIHTLISDQTNLELLWFFILIEIKLNIFSTTHIAKRNDLAYFQFEFNCCRELIQIKKEIVKKIGFGWKKKKVLPVCTRGKRWLS